MVTVNFRGPKLKVNRAKRHISEINSEIRGFLERDPDVSVVESYRDAGQYTCTYSFNDAVPDEWTTIIGDAIHNLRSALDHLAVDLVRLNNKSTKRVYFPFCDGRDSLECMIKNRHINRAAPDVVDIIRSLKPYHGGDEALRALHDLDIADKHAPLIDIRRRVHEIYVEIMERAVITGSCTNAMVQSVAKRTTGVESSSIALAAPVSKDGHIDKKFSISAEVVLNKGCFIDKPLVPTLHQLAELVDGITQTFEAHCF